MGTRNKIMFNKLIQKYTDKGQVKIEGSKLEILEQNEKKKQQIIWSLAEYNSEMTLQLMHLSFTENWHKIPNMLLYIINT